jgi:multiple sugar transport system ATP-binding protein
MGRRRLRYGPSARCLINLQVGPPREIYDRPANTFVPGFLGSPGVNFLLRALTSESGKIWWTSNGNRLGLPAEWGTVVSSASNAETSTSA